MLLFFLLSGKSGFAQSDSVAKAVSLLQDQTIPAEIRVKRALSTIDKAITDPQTAKTPYAWYVRGFVYKEWYKIFELQNKKSKARLDAVSYLKKAIELDVTKEYAVNIQQTLKYLASMFYNDASVLLDAENYSTAIENYEKYKECMLIAEPTFNLKMREIEFKNALATVYEKMFRTNIKANIQFFGKTEDLYKQVLLLDTNNWAGNYNLAMLYYNYGVDIINAMDVSSDIVVIENIQEETKTLFKKALPYALKAYRINSKKREVLIALQGIYFSLYEEKKSNDYKLELERLEKKK